MTPQTLPIDRRFKGVGRIKKASGTVDPKVRRNYNRMLDALNDDGKHIGILRAIRDGSITFAEAYYAYRHHALDSLVTGKLAKPLAPAWKKWTEGHTADYSAKHIVSLGQSLKYLTKAGAVRIADLPEALRDLRDTMGSTHPRSFNVTRAAVLAFIRSTFTRAHPLWLECSAIEVRKVTPKRKGVHLTPDQARNFFPNPDTDPVDAIAWSQMTTGMHEVELWGEWHLKPDRVWIAGAAKKRGKRRTREVPLVMRPVVPTMHERTFSDKLRERTNRKIEPYDLRRTYAHWMDEARIPRTRRQLYMGHGPRDTTDLYERHEVAAFLADDAQKLREYIGSPTISHTVRLVKSESA